MPIPITLQMLERGDVENQPQSCSINVNKTHLIVLIYISSIFKRLTEDTILMLKRKTGQVKQ